MSRTKDTLPREVLAEGGLIPEPRPGDGPGIYGGAPVAAGWKQVSPDKDLYKLAK